MSNSLVKCSKLSLKKMKCISMKNVRSFITEETGGVYSFGPDLGSQSDHYERPTPVVFISGEALSADIWFSTADFFSNRGYSGLLMSLPQDGKLENIDKAVDYFEGKRNEFGLTPPVFVSHSLSSFIAQKYLESYSLKGLIMVNPIPPNHINAVKNILAQKKQSEIYCRINVKDPGIKSNIISKFGIRYYNVSEIVSADIGEHKPSISVFPDRLCESLINDKTTVLRLEAGVVPMLIIDTLGDRKIDDENVPILMPEDIISLLSTHGIDLEKVIILDDYSRAPMISAKVADDFNIKIYDWIDNL